ncbi:invasion protein [Salmonella enterica]|nr:invasion protein [Salmonella enterica]EEK4519648.1 invasion protein [Salmonella enterica]EIP9519711.1 invasion protein [Salmonella enterica]
MISPLDVKRVERNEFYDLLNRKGSENNEIVHVEEKNENHNLNLIEVMENASEEIADVISSFGRLGRNGRLKKDIEDDYLSGVMDENCDEKFEFLMQNLPKLIRGKNSIISYARQLFPDYIDLIFILREMLLSKKISTLYKKKIQEAVSELERYINKKEIKSTINIGELAKKFKTEKGLESLSLKELRDCYLQFIELVVPSSLIYRHWIERYGAGKRYYLLSFIMKALVVDIKSNEPGIQYEEFGPLGTSLLKVRTLQTLDQRLVSDILSLDFFCRRDNWQGVFLEEHIIKLYLSGMLDEDFGKVINDFSKHYLAEFMIRQKTTVMQLLRNIYYLTPESLYLNESQRENILSFMAGLITQMYKKEKNSGIFKEYYN